MHGTRDDAPGDAPGGMSTRAHHALIELFDCDVGAIDDPERVLAALRLGAEALSTPVLGACHHRFAPHGVSAVLLVAESHLSCHTWPEAGYCAVDVYTCGRVVPDAAVEPIARALGARRRSVMDVVRGECDQPAVTFTVRLADGPPGGAISG